MAAPDPVDDARTQAEALLADLLGRNLAQAVAALATKDSVRADVAEANNSLLKWAFGLALGTGTLVVAVLRLLE